MIFGIIFGIILLSILFLQLTNKEDKKINGVFLLNENTGDISGYYKWIEELDKRGLKAIIKPEQIVLEKYPNYFKQLSDRGYEIATGYGEAPFWNMSYEEQYEIMKKYKEYAENITNKPLKIFSSKYFAYDENTLKVADELGIPFILARGTGIEARIYSPTEYKVKLIFVSNLEFGDMGHGSLCDSSLFSRGATAQDFSKKLDESFAENPDGLILVSHVYIGGTRLDWWEVYEKAIDSEKVQWNNFDEWIKNVDEIKMDYPKIPYNTEVKYIVPTYSVPLEDLELIPELNTQNKIVFFHNGQGEMCLEFLEFIKTINYTIEEHLNTEENFYRTLQNYVDVFGKSEGVSNSFEYFPIIFINNKSYSGFNEEIQKEIENEIK